MPAGRDGTAAWTIDNLNVESVNFGLITGATGMRNVQLGARIEF
jgi:hypothetical protein